MDTIAHGLTGAVIGYCGFRQRGGRAALWASIAAAEFPDIDLALGFFGNETVLRWHRSFTHSVVLWPFWAALVAWAFWELSGRRSFRWLWWASVAGIGSHLFLDWITNYGTMLLWPVSDGRFALSWVFIVDVYVWAMLLVALVAAIGTQRTVVAHAGLGIVGAYFLFCGASRAYALHTASRTPATVRLDAFPVPMNPLRWTVERDDGDRIRWICGGRNDTFAQFSDDKLFPKAEATEAVKLFRWFAAFPLVERFKENGLTVLGYRDLRFRTVFPNGRVNEGMFVVAKVVFDQNGNLLTSTLGNGGASRP